MFCPYCGRENSNIVKFCIKCGRSLKQTPDNYSTENIEIGPTLKLVQRLNNTNILNVAIKEIQNWANSNNFKILNTSISNLNFYVLLSKNYKRPYKFNWDLVLYLSFLGFLLSATGVIARLENEKILLSVAGDQPNKNIETVIRLLKLLPDNYKLIRVGRNFGTIKSVSELNLGKRVIFLGNVDSDMLANLYRGSDIFIFPSLFEGFGIPVLEAMASGIPVITSDRASLPEVVGDAGIVCDPFDLEFMRDSILEITENDSLKAELVSKGLERSKIFSSEKQFEALTAIIEKVCEE